MDVVLRDYQEKLKADIAAAYAEGYNAVCAVLPTGGGKSPLFVSIANGAMKKEKRVGVTVHRKELVKQARKHFQKNGIHTGIIMGSKPLSLAWPIQVGCTPTVGKRLPDVGDFDLIILDEGHHGTNPTCTKIFTHFTKPRAEGRKSKTRILRFTATPWQMGCDGNGLRIEGVREKLVEGPDMPWLIKNGYMAPSVVFSPPLPDEIQDELNAVKENKEGEINPDKQAIILDRPTITGDVVKHYKKICNGVPAIAFCCNIKHAQNMAAAFNAAGIPSASIDGTMGEDERGRLLDGLANGSIWVLTSCDLIGEGLDIPICTASIMIRRTQSLTVFLQQAGRSKRPMYAEGMPLDTVEHRLHAIDEGPKPVAFLIDHVGNVGKLKNGKLRIKHGFPDDPRVWSLEPTEKRRKKKDEDDEAQELVECKGCFHTFRPGPTHCPSCKVLIEVIAAAKGGGRKPLEEIQGELIEVSPELAGWREKQAKAEARKATAKARTVEDLVELARSRGYEHPERWAAKQKSVRAEAAARHRAKVAA